MFGLRGRRPSALEAYAQTVEQILLNIGVDAQAARMSMQEGYGWTFKRGSATIEIYVTQQDSEGFFQTLSPILHVPASNLLPLYRRLLEMNLQLTSVAFGIYLDAVYVFSERPLDGMDADEANTIINRVAEVADEWDDKLVAEFGGRLYTRI